MSALESLHSGAADALCSALGEPVVYTPKGASALNIVAVVTRNAMGPDGISASGLEYTHVVRIKKSDVPEVVVGGDTVAVRRRLDDEAATTYRVKYVISQAGGLWVLGVT